MTAAPDKRRRPPDQSSYEDMDVDLTLMAFRGLMPTVVASVLGSGGTACLLAFEDRNLWMILLAVLTLTFSTLRLIKVIQFPAKESDRLTPRRARQLQHSYGRVTFVYCCTVSLIVIYLDFAHAGALFLSLIAIFCICIGLASRAGTQPWISQTSGGVLLLAAAYSVIVSGLRLRWIGVAAVAFFAYQFFYTLHNQFSIVVEQLRIRRQLRILSEQDTLTGLANRRHFEISLKRLCESMTPFAILFIDLDRFKHVNDNYGHAAGDSLLIQVGERLTRTIRTTDLLARLGGDEFAILQTPLVSADSARALAGRINSDIGKPFQIGGCAVTIGASIGIRLADSGTTDANALLTKADQALYLVKQAGGGSFSLATA